MFDIDFTFRLTDVVELLGVFAGLIKLYTMIAGRMKSLNDAISSLQQFRIDVGSEVKILKGGMEQSQRALGDNMAHLANSVASLERQMQSMDDRFLRKDIHDAHMALIREQLKPIDELRQMMIALIPPTRRKFGNGKEESL